jgi:hypothetical protein
MAMSNNMKLALIAATLLAYWYWDSLKGMLSAGASEVEEEMGDAKEPVKKAASAAASAAVGVVAPVALVGESEASANKAGVKRGPQIDRPEITRNSLGRQIGVNHSEGLCGRDSASLQMNAIAKVMRAAENEECGAAVRPFNMPSHLDSTLRGM